MPTAEKQQVVSELKEILSQTQGAILTEYRGLTVAEITRFRRKLMDVDAEYHIVKNTLIKIALGDQLTPELDNLLVGPIAIVFAKKEVVAPAKATLDFIREVRKPDIKVMGGFIDGVIYNPAQVTELSKLPPREQIIASVVGSIQAPISNFVGTLDNILGEFVRTIQAIADKQGGDAATA